MPASDASIQRTQAPALLQRRVWRGLRSFVKRVSPSVAWSEPGRSCGLYQLPDASLDPQQSLAGARIPITVDVGFGDAVEPGVEDIDLPVLLDIPSPRLRAYPPETVIAAKLHAMVIPGMANSRMKDYYDVWMLVTSPSHRSCATYSSKRPVASRSRSYRLVSGNGGNQDSRRTIQLS